MFFKCKGCGKIITGFEHCKNCGKQNKTTCPCGNEFWSFSKNRVFCGECRKASAPKSGEAYANFMLSRLKLQPNEY